MPSADSVSDAVRAFAAERHLGFLATLRADGSPHVAPVGFMLDPDDVVRIITFEAATKVANIDNDPRAAVSWVDGPRWATLEGTAHVRRDPEGIQPGLEAYELKYRPPKDREDRVVIEIRVEHVLASRNLRV